MTLAEENDEAERKRARAEAALPESLRGPFGQLVDEYAVCAKIHAGEVVIEYDVLADLVRAGWRRMA